MYYTNHVHLVYRMKKTSSILLRNYYKLHAPNFLSLYGWHANITGTVVIIPVKKNQHSPITNNLKLKSDIVCGICEPFVFGKTQVLPIAIVIRSFIRQAPDIIAYFNIVFMTCKLINCEPPYNIQILSRTIKIYVIVDYRMKFRYADNIVFHGTAYTIRASIWVSFYLLVLPTRPCRPKKSIFDHVLEVFLSHFKNI